VAFHVGVAMDTKVPFLPRDRKFEFPLALFSLFFFIFSPFLFNIQMFFYTIMKLFITLLENVNKSRTSAGVVAQSIPRPDYTSGIVWASPVYTGV
jgi:hypothetical protein